MEAQKTFKTYSGKSFRLLQFSGLNNIRHNLLEDLVSSSCWISETSREMKQWCVRWDMGKEKNEGNLLVFPKRCDGCNHCWDVIFTWKEWIEYIFQRSLLDSVRLTGTCHYKKCWKIWNLKKQNSSLRRIALPWNGQQV